MTSSPGANWRPRILTLVGLGLGLLVTAAILWRTYLGDSPGVSAEKDTLVVALRNGPTSFYQDENGPGGFEYDLVAAFAQRLGLALEVRAAPSIDAMLEWVRAGAVDMAAPGVVIPRPGEQDVRLGPTYHNVDQIVVYSAGRPRPRKPSDLVGKRIEVGAQSNHVYTLERLKRDYPRIAWQESARGGIEARLEAVNERSIDVTIVDSPVFQIYRRYFPRLRRGFTVSSDNDVAWVFPERDPLHLVAAAERFIAQSSEDGFLVALNGRHYGHLPAYPQISTHYYLRHVEERLPPLEPVFREAAGRVDLDWRLLAAIAYQESHWDADAVSPTGVRGIMMLTIRTAQELGIDDRRDPAASIRGGARYVRALIDRMPSRIPHPDRTWMALAAYNIGMGHLEDSRRLTQANGADPDQWIDVARHLPLLSDETWYSRTRYGFAHGRVAVHYVEQIRSYYDILRWLDGRRPPVLASDRKIASVTADPVNLTGE